MPWGRVGGQSEKTRVAASQHPSMGPPGPTHLVTQALTEGHVRVGVAAREHLPLGQLCPQGLATDHVRLGYIGHIPHAPGGTRTGVRWARFNPGAPSPRAPARQAAAPVKRCRSPHPTAVALPPGGHAGALGAGPREGTRAAAGRRAGAAAPAGLTLASAALAPRSPRTERSTRRGSGLPRSWTTASRGGTAWALSPSCGRAEVSPVPREQVGGSPETSWGPSGRTGQATCSLQ